MSKQYVRIVDNKTTAIKYTEEALLFGTTIADVIAAGDSIVPILGDNTVGRAPTAIELANAVGDTDSLLSPLHTYQLGAANGIATLDENGDVLDDQIADEFVSYQGKWNPAEDTQGLVNGSGNIGDQYEVETDSGNSDVMFDFGSGEIAVRNGGTIVYRSDDGTNENGAYVSQSIGGLSTEQEAVLDSAMQTKETYVPICTPSAIAVEAGSNALAQVSMEECPRPEYFLEDDGGLSSVSVNAMTGEIYVNAAVDPAGEYTLKVMGAGILGQSEPISIVVTVSDA